jgi:predicted membrane-bound spermidine synthase
LKQRRSNTSGEVVPRRILRRALLLLAPFVSGAVIMALELVGLRLLAPRFGASTYVWGGLLGTIMAAMAVGYLLGGALADRRPRPIWVFGLLLASAAWVLGDLLLVDAMLDASERLGPTLGPVLATTLLLGPPMLVLGSISPFVVRLEGRLPSLGVTAGRVFALSTAGSLAGTFATAFWLIPSYGSRATLQILVTVLIVPAIAGGVSVASVGAGLLGALQLLALPLLGGARAPAAGIVFAGESPYNTVYVEDLGGNRLLRLNHRKAGFHSIRPTGGLLTGIYYDALYLAPLMTSGRSVLILGMGGGTTVRGYREFYPGARLTAVEIDPLVVRVAREYMGVDDGPDLEIHVADARPFLAAGTGRFDVVEIDVFAGGPYAPFYCLTSEFFQAVRGRLAPTGVVALNVYAPRGDGELSEAVAATMASVFASVFELPLAEERVLFAFREPVELDQVRARLASPDLPPALDRVARRALRDLRPAVSGDRAFTDDLAPVARLTHRMIERQRARLAAGDRSAR